LLAVNSTLSKTRDLLFPRLISSKLSVEDLDIQFLPCMQETENRPANPRLAMPDFLSEDDIEPATMFWTATPAMRMT